MNLLSVDWDFFFPKVERAQDEHKDAKGHGDYLLYDWGHKESPFHISGPLWPIRAAGFLTRGWQLPATNGEWTDFWARFHFAPGARLYLSESHADIIDKRVLPELQRGIPKDSQTVIYNFDAHHDGGYADEEDFDKYIAISKWRVRGRHRIQCDDWALYAGLHGIRVILRYPRWRHYAHALERGPLALMERSWDDGTPINVRFDKVFVCRSGAWTPPWVDDDFETFVGRSGLPVTMLQHKPVSRDDWWKGTVQHIELSGKTDRAEVAGLGNLVLRATAGKTTFVKTGEGNMGTLTVKEGGLRIVDGGEQMEVLREMAKTDPERKIPLTIMCDVPEKEDRMIEHDQRKGG